MKIEILRTKPGTYIAIGPDKTSGEGSSPAEAVERLCAAINFSRLYDGPRPSKRVIALDLFNVMRAMELGWGRAVVWEICRLWICSNARSISSFREWRTGSHGLSKIDRS